MSIRKHLKQNHKKIAYETIDWKPVAAEQQHTEYVRNFRFHFLQFDSFSACVSHVSHMPKANYLQNRFGKCVTGFQALNCVRFLFATLWSYVRIAFAPSRALSLSLAITLKSIQYFHMPNATLARCLCQSRERERKVSKIEAHTYLLCVICAVIICTHEQDKQFPI